MKALNDPLVKTGNALVCKQNGTGLNAVVFPGKWNWKREAEQYWFPQAHTAQNVAFWLLSTRILHHSSAASVPMGPSMSSGSFCQFLVQEAFRAQDWPPTPLP